MSLPEMPAGLLDKGVYCVRCGKKCRTLKPLDVRTYRAPVEAWLPWRLWLCAPCETHASEAILRLA